MEIAKDAFLSGGLTEDEALEKFVGNIKDKTVKGYPIRFFKYELSGGIYTISTLADMFVDYEEEGLETVKDFQEYIDEISKEFPKLNKREIVLFFLSKRIEERKDVDKFVKSILNEYGIPSNYKRDVAEYMEQLKNAAKKRMEKIQALRGIKQVKKIKLDPYIEEKITRLYKISKVPIDVLFDIINVSENVPFVHLHQNSKDVYKVYSEIKPIDSWIQNRTSYGLYFKLLSNPGGKTYETKYSDGWVIDDNLVVEYKIGDEEGDNVSFQLLVNSFDDGYVKVDEGRDIGVQGVFKVYMIFNKAIFSDIVCVDDRVSHLMFMDERENTSLEKDRFTLYYSRVPGERDPSNSLNITISPQNITYRTEKNVQYIDVRISKARSREEVDNFRELFSRVLSIHDQNRDQIVKEYGDIYGRSLAKVFTSQLKKARIQEEDKKTGAKLNLMKQINKDFFEGQYSKKCPQTRQPQFHVKKEGGRWVDDASSMQKVIDDCKKDKNCKVGEEHLFEKMQFPDGAELSFSCWDATKSHPYPRLQKGGTPCCFTTEGKGEEVKKKEKTTDKINTGYILEVKKKLDENKLGEVPPNLEYVNRAYGKGQIYRIGVPVLHSLLHCMELAMNTEDYMRQNDSSSSSSSDSSSDDKDVKGKMVFDTLKEFERMGCKRIEKLVKDEMWDYTPEMIMRKLNEKIDVRLFIKLLENHYGVDIIPIHMDKINLDGDVITPRSRDVLKKNFERKKCVVIVEYDGVYELVIKLRDSKIIGSFDRTDGFIKKLVQLYSDANKVIQLDELKIAEGGSGNSSSSTETKSEDVSESDSVSVDDSESS